MSAASPPVTEATQPAPRRGARKRALAALLAARTSDHPIRGRLTLPDWDQLRQCELTNELVSDATASDNGVVGVLVGILAGALLAAVATRIQPADWSPDPALLARLGAEVAMPGFRLRPPKGYIRDQRTHKRVRMFRWVGPPRKGGARPSLVVASFQWSAEELNRRTAAQHFDSYIATSQRSLSHWRRTPTGSGRVNGRPFLHARWSGTNPEGEKVRSFSYCAVDGPTLLIVSGQDVEPQAAHTLKLMETAALTFRIDPQRHGTVEER